MPNRIIKESICSSDNLNQLSPQEEIFFYRLIVNCDDYGIADARAGILRAKCFPLKIDSIKEKDIEQWLTKLAEQKLIFMYLIDDKRYLKMTSWEKHQQIRAKKSKYPLPDSEGVNLISNDINGNHEIGNVTVIQSNPIQSESKYNPNTNSNATSKKKYANNVFMTEEEYEKLIQAYGKELVEDKIIDLDLWKGSKGKKTKSDYMTIISWIRREKKDSNKKEVNHGEHRKNNGDSNGENAEELYDFSKYEGKV